MPQPSVFLGLGSNLGDRAAALAGARRELAHRGFELRAASSPYETEPVGGPAQGWFLNQVLAGETSLSPRELLSVCLSIEDEMGRVRGAPNDPRTIDIDLLLYGDRIVDEPDLVLPHPRLHLRRFVLVPLAELAPDAVHPTLGLRAADLLKRCPDTSVVRRGLAAAP
jgi:2-amino-4-hydroxy-6-hydroxymethyldihydropteridine diphosphokinase